MGFSDGTNTTFSVPMVPMYGNYGGNGGGFGDGIGGGMGAWWLLVLLFAMRGGWGNNDGGNGGGGYMPYIVNSGMNGDVQRGFDQQAVISGVSGVANAVNNGFSNVQQSLCNGFAGVNATVTNGFAAAEASESARQVANMQQQFALQQQLSQCCCDNRLATAETRALVLSENCEDRNALNNGVRDILLNDNNNTQRLVDVINGGITRLDNKLCQLELDAYKQRLDEALARNVALENAAARANDRAIILADNAAQTAALEQYLRPQANPAYIVPNPNCCNNNYGNSCGGY